MRHDRLLSSPSQNSAPLWIAIAIVCALHLLLLGVSTIWSSSSPPPKPRTKLIAHTVRLDSFAPSLSAPVVSAPIIPPTTIPEEKPIVKEKIEKQEPVALIPPVPETLPEPKAPEVPPQVVENKPIPQPTPPPAKKPEPPKKQTPPKKAVDPKPATKPQETPVKAAAPAKKQPSKTEQVKGQEEKKEQQQKAEKEKKQQEEKLAKEKKQQEEKLEKEAQRKKEIAAAEKIAKQKEEALVAQARENLAKISQTRDKMNAVSSNSAVKEIAALPTTIGSLHIDALPVGETTAPSSWGSKEMSYSDEVAFRLKNALKLPEYGSVKIKLVIDRTGKVVQFETIHSESSKNKTYIESKIRSLLFSHFGQRFPGVTETAFVITLKNEKG